ncbi:MAG: ABC transporter ATP-binding protein, partial [Clostridium sp.]
LGVPDAQILSFDDGRVEEITYEQTASYQITEMFINNRDYMLDKLLREDDI